MDRRASLRPLAPAARRVSVWNAFQALRAGPDRWTSQPCRFRPIWPIPGLRMSESCSIRSSGEHQRLGRLDNTVRGLTPGGLVGMIDVVSQAEAFAALATLVHDGGRAATTSARRRWMRVGQVRSMPLGATGSQVTPVGGRTSTRSRNGPGKDPRRKTTTKLGRCRFAVSTTAGRSTTGG